MTAEDRPHYSAIIDGYSMPELKLALLRAIDHARKCSAEIERYKSQLDAAVANTIDLRAEIQSLKTQLNQSSSAS